MEKAINITKQEKDALLSLLPSVQYNVLEKDFNSAVQMHTMINGLKTKLESLTFEENTKPDA